MTSPTAVLTNYIRIRSMQMCGISLAESIEKIIRKLKFTILLNPIRQSSFFIYAENCILSDYYPK